jgi:hypothetical protein
VRVHHVRQLALPVTSTTNMHARTVSPEWRAQQNLAINLHHVRAQDTIKDANRLRMQPCLGRSILLVVADTTDRFV